MKKVYKISLVSLFIIGVIGFLLIAFPIDISSTLKSKYLETSNPGKHIIITHFFKMEAPKEWTHISGGFGSHGEYIGHFLTPKGTIYYEYGILVNSYNPEFSPYDSSIYKQKDIGRFIVDIIEDEQETGISIPPQHEMGFPFSMHKSEAVKNNLQEILDGIATIEFAASKPVFKEKK